MRGRLDSSLRGGTSDDWGKRPVKTVAAGTRHLWIIATCCALAIASSLLLISALKQAPVGQPANDLAMKPEQGDFEVPARDIRDKGSWTKERLWTLRMNAARDAGSIIAGNYAPSGRVFGEIAGDHPWLPVQNFYLLGPAASFFDGPPVEMKIISNPLHLITAEFRGLSIHGRNPIKWRMDRITDEALASPGFPFYPIALRLNCSPRNNRLTLFYDLSGYIASLGQWVESVPPLPVEFAVSGLNAADFGYRYISLKMSESLNIETGTLPDEPSPIEEKLGYDAASCHGAPKGCNQRIGKIREYDSLLLKSIPAFVTFFLWKEEPGDAATEPDIRFSIQVQ